MEFPRLSRRCKLALSGLALLLGLCIECAFAGEAMNPLELHHQALVFDTHADTVLRIVGSENQSYQLRDRHTEKHIDLPRLKEGGIDIQGFALWVDPEEYAERPSARAWQLLEVLEGQLSKNPDLVSLVRTAAEARRVVQEGKIGMLLGIEGGHALEGDLDLLRRFHARGARYVTLTWMNTTTWADSSTDDPKWGGLNELGVKFIKEMNQIGMMIDLAHVSDDTVLDVLEVSEDPVIVSHGAARALCDHPRNINDDLLKRIALKGGVIGVNYYMGYLHDEFSKAHTALEKEHEAREKELAAEHDTDSEEYKEKREELRKEFQQRNQQLPGIDTDYRIIVDHIDHIVKVAGVDHVGLGSDFDGFRWTPVGMDDVTCVPKITEELIARGYSPEDVRKILGENMMRVFDKICGQ
jgi:membrane dipeptidase